MQQEPRVIVQIVTACVVWHNFQVNIKELNLTYVAPPVLDCSSLLRLSHNSSLTLWASGPCLSVSLSILFFFFFSDILRLHILKPYKN